MVAHFSGEGPRRRVRYPHKGIATAISEGRLTDLYVVTGILGQVCAWNDGDGIPSDAHLKTGHINGVDDGVVIGATNHDIARAEKYLFIKLHHQGTLHVDLGSVVRR